MNYLKCVSCRASLRKASRIRAPSIRTYSSASTPTLNPESQGPTQTPAREPKTFDIGAFLSKPSWSVRSLLPDPNTLLKEEITPKQLHHLLRLSALPLPKSPEEEAQMLKTLHTQLHFVRDIQSVDTEGIEPLQSIRDETTKGIEEATIGLGTLEGALKEEVYGKRNGRPRRVVEEKKRDERRDGERGTPLVKVKGDSRRWDVMATAKEKIVTPNGSYFVVRSGKVESRVEEEIQEPEKVGESPP